MTIFQYLAGAGALILAIYGWLFQRRGQRIQNLEAQLGLQKGQAEIDLTKHEVNESEKKSNESSGAYDDLKRANAELAHKLGIDGPNSP